MPSKPPTPMSVLGRDLGLSQEEIGRRTGKDRTSITNALRLLKLPPEVQLLLAEHRLSMGHARAILGLPTAEQQIEVAEKTAAQGLSVRQVEALVQDLTSDRTRTGDKKEKTFDPNVRAAVEEMERALGTRVRIVELSEQRGRIEIEYYSQAELDRLFQQITGVNWMCALDFLGSTIGAGGRTRTYDLRIMRPSL